jgi:uncharacterized protein (TIGR02246 family)
MSGAKSLGGTDSARSAFPLGPALQTVAESEMPQGQAAIAPARTTVPAETEITALFDRLIAAWNTGNSEAYGQAFTRDADYVAFDGTHLRGRPEIVRVHRQLFDTHLRGSTLSGKITSIRLVNMDVAIVHTTGDTRLAGRDAPSPERHSIQTFVAIHDGNEWRFTAFHNNRIRPIGPGRSGILWLVTDWLWRQFGPRQRD